MQINLMQTNHTDITAEISGKEGNCSDRGSIALSCERVWCGFYYKSGGDNQCLPWSNVSSFQEQER